MTETGDRIVIPRRFNGPPDSGQGGYASGVVARLVAEAGGGAVARAWLRRPPPLQQPLVVEVDDGAPAGEAPGPLVRLRTGAGDGRDSEAGDGGADDGGAGELVAEGRPAILDLAALDVPDPVTADEAAAALLRPADLSWHPFPTCYACGPERPEGEGLQLFTGWVGGRDREVVAAPLTFPASAAADDGEAVPTEMVWAALDCPSGWAFHGGDWRRLEGQPPAVLGTMAAEVRTPLVAGRAYVAAGWPLQVEGRKMHSASAIFADDGELLAVAHATWIQLRPESA